MAQTRQLSGNALLRSVRENLAMYRDAIEPSGKGIAVVRFTPTDSDSPEWVRRMEASRVSANQKVKAFSYLGFTVDHLVLPGTVSAAEFADRIDAFNADDHIRAIIVQFPPPARLTPLVQRLEQIKDIDGLLEDRSPHRACATADGISRVVIPVAEEASIAVVGARGFVGRGVVRLLKDHGLDVIPLDIGDDLRRAAHADIVVSTAGKPHILTPDHIKPHHRLVVDSGFTPLPDGTVAGDIHPAATYIPQNITPVPGGVGPIEMAVLMDRIIRQEADPELTPWTCPQAMFLPRTHFVETASHPGPTGRARQPLAQPKPPPQRGHDHGRDDGRTR
ncbi:bifunctional 5,10-methylenetetrahydrofolate dehydrogenase/5,10-methenyltetrahydrofolate cyclohydrolase [Streptomyces sp. SPB074]|uniref:bifunctional 5,10-methylenetetrahydrofolate dehydrogenase/5,10-methenyltetrahydrofolate cyclohydrolase n=1 Tax=Streptomyces sp. (strain SPB074) TaxID=465543 RepID=UPI00017FE830|nr:bifunctional 5,10-methylenetetrahydrofolate dehydrogenase/5,10-methenyltetrahydrofolate cyclohydrolase [Streptomyces sp. SPB074]EDY43402.1 methylenetetrahydrofolate dehydrogenase [Streptomyces sp. SPB074]